MNSIFDFIDWTEYEMYSRLPRNTLAGDSDKEALMAVEFSEFLEGKTKNKRPQGGRHWSRITNP